MNKTILLINPREDNMILADNPSFVDEERGYNPPLGILYIATAIKYNTDWEVVFIDMNAEKIKYEELPLIIAKKKPMLVGMTALTFTIIDVLKVAEIVKCVDKEIKIMLGGIHPYIYPEETIRLKNIDYICLGEGEKAIVEFLEKYPKVSEVKGFYYKDGSGKICNTGYLPMIENLDTVRFPDRRLSKYKLYTSILAKKNPITTMITSRGCPFQCTYCIRPHFGKICRFRSPKNIIEEVKDCVELGIKEIFFYDDTFTINKKRVIEFCEEMIKEGLNQEIKWDIRSRVDTVDQKMINLLKKAGCDRIHFGIESANERILKILKKNINLKETEEIFKICDFEGVTAFAYFMIGSPTESKEEILNTIDFASRIKVKYSQITITTPFPETEIYKELLVSKYYENDYWKKFAENPTRDFKVKYYEDKLNEKELFDLLKLFYKKFYFRPKFIFNEFLKIRSFSELFKKIKAAVKIILS